MSVARGLVLRYPNQSSRDLVHAATCHVGGVDVVVSPDRDFDEVDRIRRIDPLDADALFSHLR